MLTYRTVLTVAALGLGVRYLFHADATVLWRAILAVILFASFFVPDSPVGQVVGIVVQLTLSLFVLFRLKMNAS